MILLATLWLSFLVARACFQLVVVSILGVFRCLLPYSHDVVYVFPPLFHLHCLSHTAFAHTLLR